MDFIHHALQEWGYFGIFIVILIDNINIPIPPTEVVLSLAGWYISTGRWEFWPVFVLSTIGGTMGCVIFYYLVRYFHEWMLPFMKCYLHLTDEKIEKADRFFLKYGGLAIFFGRLLPGMRTISLIPAGMVKYPVWKMTIYLFFGTAIWNFVLLTLGHQARNLPIFHLFP